MRDKHKSIYQCLLLVLAGPEHWRQQCRRYEVRSPCEADFRYIPMRQRGVARESTDPV